MTNITAIQFHLDGSVFVQIDNGQRWIRYEGQIVNAASVDHEVLMNVERKKAVPLVIDRRYALLTAAAILSKDYSEPVKVAEELLAKIEGKP